MTNPTPRNAQQANEQAKRFQKALTMKAEGYRMEDATKDCYDVYKPGNFVMPDYTVDLYRNTCDCPDGKKGNICKHRYFVELELDDRANMEAQCAEFDALMA